MGELPEIFGSISVGFFSIIVISLFFLFILVPGHRWNSSLKDFRTLLGSLGDHAFASFFVATFIIPLVYGLGLVVQDFTDNLTDREKRFLNKQRIECSVMTVEWLKGPLYMMRTCLGGEGELRTRALINLDSDINEMRGGDCYLVELNGLAKNLMSVKGMFILPSPVISKVGGVKYECINKTYGRYLNSGGLFIGLLNDINRGQEKDVATDCPQDILLYSQEDLEGKLNKLYYRAKNWAYRERETHFKELSSIQRRIDFSRSVFMLTIWGALLLMSAVVVCPILHGIDYLSRRVFQMEREVNDVSACMKSGLLSKYKCLIAILLVMVAFSFLTVRGYWEAENVYNERVYGYYASYCEDHGSKCY